MSGIHRYRYRHHAHAITAEALACIASATHIHIHRVYPPANRPASAHAYYYNKLTCLHTLLLSRSRSLCMCCPFPSLSHPSVSCHPPPFICPPRSSPARLHRILRTAQHAEESRLLDTEDARTARRPSPQAATALRTAQELLAARHLARPGSSVHATTTFAPPRLALRVSPFFPLRRPPARQPLRAPAQVPAVLVHPRPQCMDGPRTHTKGRYPTAHSPLGLAPLALCRLLR